MKKKALLPLFLGIMVFWLVVTILNLKNVVGFLQYIRRSNENVLDWLGNNLLNDNYGLAIIILVLVIRIILLPFMLSNYKNSHMMRQK